MAIVLLVTTNNGQTVELPILGKCTLGRSSQCDLTIEDKQMSGRHGMFEISPSGQLHYIDLGSTNGSYLNNSQIQETLFRFNETLRLGSTTITIDEKRLTSKERLAIGRGIANKEDSTIMVPSNRDTKSIIRTTSPLEEEGEGQLQKQKSKMVIPIGGKKETLIERDKSSGKTKFLKLDINKHKKK
ncbi:MAG: FHA domain-containing protein [Bacteriovorax sp.]